MNRQRLMALTSLTLLCVAALAGALLLWTFTRPAATPEGQAAAATTPAPASASMSTTTPTPTAGPLSYAPANKAEEVAVEAARIMTTWKPAEDLDESRGLEVGVDERQPVLLGGPPPPPPALAARELDRRAERPRPGDLDLERAGPAVVGLGELVEVLAQEGAGPPFVMAGTAREAPPVGLGLDVQSLEQARRAPDHVGPDPTTGQLGQVRDAVAEQVADGDDGLARSRAGPRPDTGRPGHALVLAARPARAMVPEPTTRVPS